MGKIEKKEKYGEEIENELIEPTLALRQQSRLEMQLDLRQQREIHERREIR